MNRTEFKSSEPLMDALKEILSSKTMEYALSVIEQESIPDAPNALSGDLLHQMTINGAKSMGAFDAIRRLRLLAVADKVRSVNEASENDDAAIAQMVESGLYTIEQAKAIAEEFRKTQQ